MSAARFRAAPAAAGLGLGLITLIPLADRSNLPLLNLAQAHAGEVLVADSRVTDLPDPSYQEIARIEALTIPNLGEFDEFRTAHLFQWRGESQPD